MVFKNVLDMVSRERGEIKKSWHVEWFYGNDLKVYWTKNSVQGTPTFAMVDDINEGFEIVTSAVTNDTGSIDFNNIRHYDPTSAIIIGIVRNLSIADHRMDIGLANELEGATDFVVMNSDSSFTNYALQSVAIPPSSTTESSIPNDIIFHRHKIELFSTFMQLHIDGILEVTKTTDIPLDSLQPVFNSSTRTTASKTHRIRYLEVFNT